MNIFLHLKGTSTLKGKRAMTMLLTLLFSLLWILDEAGTVHGGSAGISTNSTRVEDPPASKRCPFAVDDEQDAIAKAEDASAPGSVVNVTDLDFGRLGNHFAIAARFLALGYCCKSKLVTLPAKDPTLAPALFGQGTAGPRHFDFTEAPGVPGFDPLVECPDEYTVGGAHAYHANFRTQSYPSGMSRNEPLTSCIENTRLLECEATYYFPTDLDLCDPHPTEGASLSVATEARNLVVHVRSGDIFRGGRAYGNYGQPPLSYYTALLNSEDWKRVDIVTHAISESAQNPVLSGLQIMVDTGSWPRTVVNTYTERDIDVDLRAMLCADALATSRSTLGELTMYHTRAKTVYLSSTCDGEGSEFGLTPRRLIDVRSNIENNFRVLGIELKPNAPHYTVYDVPDAYDDLRQRIEILTYQGVAGLTVCS